MGNRGGGWEDWGGAEAGGIPPGAWEAMGNRGCGPPGGRIIMPASIAASLGLLGTIAQAGKHSPWDRLLREQAQHVSLVLRQSKTAGRHVQKPAAVAA